MAEMMDRKRLIEYLPDFMQNFSEIKELMRVTNIESDRIYPLIGRILDEAFIEDCSEHGIQKYEKLLGIIPNADDSLEIRRSRVRLYWNNEAPYTYRVLVRKMNMLCGMDNYDIDPEMENYRMEFNIYNASQVAELEELLEKMLPENMAYSIYAAASHSGTASAGIVWQQDEIFYLKEAIL